MESPVKVNRYNLRIRKPAVKDGPKPKRIKLEVVAEQNVPDVIDAQNASLTKLTDVNDDCLEHIFLYLSLRDLLSIADSSKSLKTATDMAFARNFGGKKSKALIDSRTFRFEVNGYAVELNNPYRLLRSFGHLIRNLIIHESKIQRVISYVNEYCSESLTDIAFYKMSRDDFSGLKKSFVNVEVVSFMLCVLNWKSMQMNKCFPNMRTLKFFRVDAQPRCIEVHFPNLKHLEIKGQLPAPKKIVMNLFTLNPQLSRLVLNTNYHTTMIRAAREYLPYLEQLDIRANRKDFTDFGDETVRFENLKVLTINYDDVMMTKVPILANCLQEFSWTFFITGLSKHFIDFLTQHSSITKLNMVSSFIAIPMLSGEITNRIITALSKLEEISFQRMKISILDAIQLTKNCKSLRKLSFTVDKVTEFNDLKARLDVGWKVFIIREDILHWFNITVVKLDT